MIKKSFLFLATVLLFTSCDYSKPTITPSSKVVKIGVLAPLNGNHRRYGYQSLLGLESANKMQMYLSNGDKIVFEIVDTQGDKNSSISALSKLPDDVVAIFSFVGSSHMLAMDSAIETKKIPVIATIATHSDVAKVQGYTSQVCMSNHMQTMVSSHYLRDEKLIDNIGIVYNKSSTYSSALAKEFAKYFSNIGGKIDFFIDVSSKSVFRELELKKDGMTQMIFNVTNANDSVKILKFLNKISWKIELLGTDGLLSDALGQSSSDIGLFDGVYVVDHYAHHRHNTSKQKNINKKF